MSSLIVWPYHERIPTKKFMVELFFHIATQFQMSSLNFARKSLRFGLPFSCGDYFRFTKQLSIYTACIKIYNRTPAARNLDTSKFVLLGNIEMSNLSGLAPKERSVNFTKEEINVLKNLIDKYSTELFNKKTDHISNSRKNSVWQLIEIEYNAQSSRPRNLKQLQAKFDNFKRTARKEASAERRALFATGGGPAERGGVSTDTEWLRKVMPVSMDGLESVCDDDIICGEKGNTSNAADAECVEVGEILHNEDRPESPSAPIVAKAPAAAVVIDTAESKSETTFDSKAPAFLLRTRLSKPLRPANATASQSRIRKRPRPAEPDCEVKQLRIEAIEASKQYDQKLFEVKLQNLLQERKYTEEKRQEEKELNELKKKKLQVEMNILLNQH